MMEPDMPQDLYHKAIPIAARSLRLLPFAPANIALGLLTRRLARRHHAILDRLKPIEGKRFRIQITDLGVDVLLVVQAETVSTRLVRQAVSCDVDIAGTLSILLSLLEGEMDGDALFFSRELSVSGDTEALLTLRNALDCEDFSLKRELAALAGPLEPVIARFFETGATHQHGFPAGGQP